LYDLFHFLRGCCTLTPRTSLPQLLLLLLLLQVTIIATGFSQTF
jgi:hypothetical protein